MVSFNKSIDGVGSINIQLLGEKEDYLLIFRTLISLMGRVDKDRMMDNEELYYMSALLDGLTPTMDQLCPKMQQVQ